MAYQDIILATPNILAYWRLGEASGTSVVDSFSTKHGTYINSPTLGVAGAIVNDADTAVTFTGTNYVSGTSLTLPTLITIEGWVKGTLTNNSALWSQWSTNGSMLYFTAGTVRMYANTSFAAFAVTAANWTHLVGTFDGANIKLYINSVLVATQPVTGTITTPAIPWNIGTYNNAGGNEIVASADDISIYSRALTQDEISEHYFAGKDVHLGFGQAQTKISAYNVEGFGQARSFISKSAGYGQAQARIIGFNVNRYAQAYSFILGTSLCNSNSTGNVLVVTGTTETILPGASIPIRIPDGASVGITWNVWISHVNSGTYKRETINLRRDNTAGEILATYTTPSSDGGDNGGGHQFNWTGSFNDTSPTTGRYVLSVKELGGGVGNPANTQIYSDTRTFCVTARSFYQGFGQAEASIADNADLLYKGFGQAQAYISAYDVNQSGQAQALITNDLYPDAVRADAPSVYYRLLETSGTNAVNDITPGTGDGTYGSGPTLNQSGPLFKSIYLDGGANDYLLTGNTEDVNLFSLEWWAKIDSGVTIGENGEGSGGAPGVSGQRYIWQANQKGGNRGLGVSLGTNGIAVYFHGDFALYTPANYYIDLGTDWHYYVVTNTNGTVRIYIDGVLVRTGLATGHTAYTPNKFGASGNGNWAGYAAEIAIYPDVLTDSRILDHYEGFLGIPPSEFNFGQAQAKINAFDIGAFGQAQAQIIRTFRGFGQANAQVGSFNYGQSQGLISRTYNGIGQANAYIHPRVGLGQTQAQIIAFGVNRSGQAKALIVRTNINKVAQSAGMISVPKGHGQAQAQIKTSRKWGFGLARAFIGHFGTGQAQAFITKQIGLGQAQAQISRTQPPVFGQAQASIWHHKGYGQAKARILQTYRGVGQAQALLNQGFGLANAKAQIKQTYASSGQTKARIKATYRQFAQAQAVIYYRYYVSGQAGAWISRQYQGYGQAAAQIGFFKFGQAQARVISFGGAPSFAQAQGYIAVPQIGTGPGNQINPHIGTYPRSDLQTYLVRYNDYKLPGYAQRESYESFMKIMRFNAAYAHNSFSDYEGLENKRISLEMLAWEPTYALVKEQIMRAAVMLRSYKGYAKLYIQQPNAHMLVLVQGIQVEKSVGTSMTLLGYKIEFEAKPWLIDNAEQEFSGTESIVTEGRTLSDGGWTPTIIIVSGTDVTITGTTDTGVSTGTIVIDGEVTDLIIDTEQFTATEDGVNANSKLVTKNYSMYVGPGVTTFTVTGATSFVVRYNNRWYLASKTR